MYLLDTNVCIKILNKTSPKLIKRLKQHSPYEIYLSSVVKAELLYGARKSKRNTENLAILEQFFSAFVSLPFDDVCAEHYGFIRADLENSGSLIGPNDLLIAAIARANDFILVTHNTGEFSRVVGLKLIDWEI
jgi:tRNA(fMet)-specific endonuclease VapC